MVAKKKYITKTDIEEALKIYDSSPIETLREDIKKLFPVKEKPKRTRTVKPKDDEEKPKEKAEKKPRKKTATKSSESKPEKEIDHSGFQFPIGSNVFLWFKNEKLPAVVTEHNLVNATMKVYKIEWVNYDSLKNHPFVLGSKYKYVSEQLLHSMLEVELNVKGDD